MTGSKHSIRNVEYVQKVLKSVGVEPERVQMHFCSAAEGQKFQTTVKEMAKKIAELGKSPLKEFAEQEKKKKKKKSKSAPKKKNK
ncbi:MAG: hydrogenase iron-sulfur subunit [Candidatus Lokiarchaeota archaeon]|nr:hydrogenase iron-sulfur subunit [Candidatus Lokiarchaeota archaeon]